MYDVTLGEARAAMKAAEDVAATMGIRIATTVADSGGNLVAFARMDGTQLASTGISQGKAYTAVAWNRRSDEMFDVSQPGQSGYALQAVDPRYVFAGGGVPVRGSNGELRGAVGVSGGTADQDRDCAEAAVEAVERSSKSR
ncbi:heme-binding protein [Isoptericola sp. b441]|uniref:Heme-binding protein n=1 Tax=Actinotalea lenta TaxID=3064654 RepID=A0ABT9D6Q8_9CELL|nr:heme-binding protein [Isoptericola sp. b441]MDO8106519.1 heme-binding protein [Isoptericola sp. b441]